MNFVYRPRIILSNYTVIEKGNTRFASIVNTESVSAYQAMTLMMSKSQTITKAGENMDEYIPTPTVGEIIAEEFLKPLNMSENTLAKGIGLSEQLTRAILEGNVQVTPELSKRLSSFFGMSEMFFYRLQQDINERNAVLVDRELAYA